jgi:predicted ATPase
MFTDVEGSTRALEQLGAEAYGAALEEHRRHVREAIAGDGVEVDTQGDAFFVVFESAAAAVEAALRIQAATRRSPIKARIGLHTGTPARNGDGYIGQDVHLAARIAAAGHGGQILMSRATHDASAAPGVDLGEHRVKDFTQPVWIFQAGGSRFPPIRTISNTNLPRPASNVIGRERELAELRELVPRNRIVTLLGPGGSGKTRLAIEAATDLVSNFKNGVFWVDLTPVTDPALVPDTIASALGATGNLADFLAAREVLLLLDNFEQVVAAAPAVADLVEGSPRLAVIVTSRERLRVRGEHAYPVGPLNDQPAAHLFAERSGMEIDDDIRAICRDLDGLPLAIELAAARTSTLSPKQLRQRLGDRLDFLRGGRDASDRQRTLRATLEWSFDLLSEEEKRVFARLSVFRGGCTPEAAETVTGADIDLLGSLADKSLMRREGERLKMLETLREFGAERLEEIGEVELLRGRHAQSFVTLTASSTTNGLVWHYTPEWMRICAQELDNFRAALEWCDANASFEDLRVLTMALSTYWLQVGAQMEAERWFTRVLSLLPDDSPRRADILAIYGEFPRYSGEPERALEIKKQAIAASADNRGLYLAVLADLASLSAATGDARAATEWAEKAVAERTLEGSPIGIGHALVGRGEAAIARGDIPEAERAFREAYETSRAAQDDIQALETGSMLAEAMRRNGNELEAAALFRELGREGAEWGSLPTVVSGLLGAAHSLAAAEPETAAQMVAIASEMMATTSARPYWVIAGLEQVRAEIERNLGPTLAEEEIANARFRDPLEVL